MSTSEWTEGGLRLVVEFVNGMIILTAQSQSVLKTLDAQEAKEGRPAQAAKFERGTWMLSQLGIPNGTPRAEAERLVRQWLGSYDDPDFREKGLAAFRAAFMAVPEQVAQPGKSVAPGNMN